MLMCVEAYFLEAKLQETFARQYNT